MKYHTPLITAALLASLITGCSKYPSPPAASPGAVDFGVVEVSDSGTNHFDSDLGDGKFCVVRSFVIGDHAAGQMVVSSGAIEVRGPTVRGGVQALITFDPRTNSPDQAVEFSNGYYHIKVQPHIKP